MRSLKKALTLALVFVMALGLLSASALDFKDAEDIQYKEAVEVMTAIGAINGFPDGTFQPDGLVTRAQAAKLVSYVLLTPKVADTLTTTATSFTDVKANDWFAPYVEYCASLNIINGLPNGTFNPNGNVTGIELAKMLLVALGYGKNSEFVGSRWALNVTILANEIGLFKGSKAASFAAPATREEAALYVFNALNADQKYWDKNKEIYDDLGTKLVDKYALVKDTTPVNGVNGYTWKIAGKAVSSFYVTENVVGTSTDGTPLSNLTTKGDRKFIAETESDVAYFINGKDYTYQGIAGDNLSSGGGLDNSGKTYTTFAAYSADGNTTYANEAEFIAQQKTQQAAAATTAIDKSGVIVKFINLDTDVKVEKISITEKTVGYVTGAPSVNPNTGAVTIPGLTTYPKDTVDYPADLALGDYVLYYTDALGVTHVEKATKVTGQMTSANTVNKTISFAGNTYAESELVTSNSVVPVFYGNSANFNVDAVAFLDDNGDIVGIYAVTQSGPAAKYGLVVDYEYAPAGTGTFGTPASAKVLLYTEDGKVAVYNVAKNASGVVPDQRSSFNFSSAPHAYLVSYAINDNGEVTLTTVGTSGTVNGAGTAKSPVISIESGSPASTSNYYITSNTKVIYFNDQADYSTTTPVNVAKFVTGYANTDAAADDMNVTFVLKSGTSNIEVIFIGQAPASVTVPGNYAYVHTVNERTHSLCKWQSSLRLHCIRKWCQNNVDICYKW